MRLLVTVLYTMSLLMVYPSTGKTGLLSNYAYGQQKVNTMVVGKVVTADNTTIIRRGISIPFKASPNLEIHQGDKIIIGSHISWICFIGFRQYDWDSGEKMVDCHEADLSTDPYNASITNSRSKVPTVQHDNEGIERPKGGVNNDWIAIITRSRPSYWRTSLCVNPAITFLHGQEKSSLESSIKQKNTEGKISKDAQQLLFADLGSMSKFYDQAREDLLQVTSSHKAPFIQIMLGDLYLADLAPVKAKQAYNKAIQLAHSNSDILAEAYGQHTLGLIREFEGAKQDAITILSKAVKLYESLGDTDTMEQLKKRIYALRMIRR